MGYHDNLIQSFNNFKEACVTPEITRLNTEVSNKQDKLTAGAGISISNGVISLENTTTERLIASLTGTVAGVGLSTLLKQFYPYLQQLTQAQLRSSYIVLSEGGTFQWLFRYSSHLENEYYSFAVLDNYDDKSAIFTAETLIITENEAFMGDTMFFSDNKIVGGDLYGDNVTVNEGSTYSLFVVENVGSDALITTSEFENLT